MLPRIRKLKPVSNPVPSQRIAQHRANVFKKDFERRLALARRAAAN